MSRETYLINLIEINDREIMNYEYSIIGKNKIVHYLR